jgi:N-acyl-D-aspartate/D-glutamate deacylase
LFTNVMVFDGSGSPSFPGEVLVQGNGIKAVAKGRNNLKWTERRLSMAAAGRSC